MSVPGIVEGELGDEDVAARVSLSGGDEAFVTPTRTLVYRAEGLLSDESVEAYPHEADRLLVSEGRRKTKVELEYVDGTESFAVPGDRLHDLLEPLIAGVIRNRGVVEDGERIAGAFRFSELTLVVTSERLLRQIGGAVWDATYDDYHFDDVTGLEYEEGSVATQVVLTVDGRKQRIKTPNDRFDDVKECLESALFTYHDVASAEELAEKAGVEDGDDGGQGEQAEDSVVSMSEGVDPLTTGDAADPEAGEDQASEDRTAATSTDAGGRTTGSGGGVEDADAATGDGADAGSGDGADAGSGDAPAVGDEGTEGDGATTGVDADDAGGADDGWGSADPDAGSEDADGTGAAGDPTTGEDGADEDTDEEGGADGGDDGVPFSETFEPVADPQEELREEVEALRSAVERQNELLARQQETIETLVEELDQAE